MNYSKDSRQKDKELTNETTKKKKQKQKKAKVSVWRIIFIILVIGVFAAVGAGLGIFVGIIQSAPDISTLELKPTTDFTSFVYDENGTEIDRISSGEDRIYVGINEIPKHFQDAVVAIEDERFYEHNGIDIRGIFRALWTNFTNPDTLQGASTITQQLIKNNVLTSEQTITRKIQEQYLAIQFDAIYTKELILEYYLNTFALGHGQNGVQAAANYYFAKDASELTLAESAVLAGITKAPTRYSPVLNPENNWERAQVILTKMEELGMITADEKAAALEENPYLNIAQLQQELKESSTHSYFVDAVIDQVISDLQTVNGITKTQANNLVYGGGIQIFTTLNQDMQGIVDKHMADPSLFPSKIEYVINYAASIEKPDGTVSHRGGKGVLTSNDADSIAAFQKTKLEEWGAVEGDEIYGEVTQIVPQTQAAFVIMDHFTGHVKALSGGRGEKYGDRVFNRATQAYRQPGSTFKPLASYAPALDMGILSPGSIIVDAPLTIGKYTPSNWYSGYRGASTVREGIYDSMNILAVKALQLVGLDAAFDYLLNFGFTSLDPAADKYYPMALGGISGVTPLELNAAYGAIANQGTYVKPILYTQVLDMDGNVLIDNSAPITHTVIKESTASMLTDMMVSTVKQGTAYAINYDFKGMPVAGKTGTTQDDKDFLFAGYTPYYTATVWMGYDDPKKFSVEKKHLALWANIMRDIHEGLPSKSFEMVTTGYSKATICSLSGKLPTKLCQSAPNNKIVTDYFNKNSIPTEYCDAHAEIKICTVSGKIATEYCPADVVQTQIVAHTPGGQVTPQELCDVHTLDSVAPPSIWPPWPEIPGLGGDDDDDSSTYPPTPEEPDGDSDGDGNDNGNNGGNTGVPDTDSPDTDSPDIVPPPTPTPPPVVPDEDDFYIPQG